MAFLSAKELPWLKTLAKKVTVRLTEEEKKCRHNAGKQENKSIQNFIYDRIMPAQNQQNADVKMTNWWQI